MAFEVWMLVDLLLKDVEGQIFAHDYLFFLYYMWHQEYSAADSWLIPIHIWQNIYSECTDIDLVFIYRKEVDYSVLQKHL